MSVIQFEDREREKGDHTSQVKIRINSELMSQSLRFDLGCSDRDDQNKKKEQTRKDGKIKNQK